MARPAGPTSTTESIDWREARYLARVVEMLMTSRVDKAEFKRELDQLMSAARALRAGSSAPVAQTGRADRSRSDDATVDATEEAAEVAVLALWRTEPAAASDDTEAGRGKTAAGMLHVSPSIAAPVDEAELARAVDEITRAAAALRDEEPTVACAVAEIERAATALRDHEPIAAVPSEAARGRRSWWVWLQIAGLWVIIAVATVALLVGLVVFSR
jgi:hypothetical protein